LDAQWKSEYQRLRRLEKQLMAEEKLLEQDEHEVQMLEQEVMEVVKQIQLLEQVAEQGYPPQNEDGEDYYESDEEVEETEAIGERERSAASYDGEHNLLNLKDLLVDAKQTGDKLGSLLRAPNLEEQQLTCVLRHLGQIARGIYLAAGANLRRNQLRIITESTQSLLRIGLEVKHNPEADTLTKRIQLTSAFNSMLQIMEEVVSQHELGDHVSFGVEQQQ